MRTTLFVNVIIPLPVEGVFTYRVPFEWNDKVEVGKRVIVQFGRKKLYTALIEEIIETPPKQQAKYILDIIDEVPVVNDLQLKLWKWISEYYMCTIGETMNVALPSGLKLASETKIYLNTEVNFDKSILNEREFALLNSLKTYGSLTINEAIKITEQQKIIPLLNTLVEKGFIQTEELIKERFQPKTVTIIEITKKYNSEENLKSLFDKLEKKAPKQLALLMAYLQLSKFFSENPLPVEKTELIKTASSTNAALNALIKKEIFTEDTVVVDRLKPFEKDKYSKLPKLSNEQETAFSEIKKYFTENKPVLLHGVTSSGKTELYIRLINETIAAGKQVLYLLPEIALTTQMVNRVKRHFGDMMGVYHSKYNENERVELWSKVKNHNNNENIKLVLGARSALFLPYNNLGLIIVDEEHDTSYKQYDPAPRYNARDAAVYMAMLHKANVLLGSATPSIESYYNTQINKFGLVELKNRYGGVKPPNIKVVDLKKAHKNRSIKSVFSQELINEIQKTLDDGYQAILFQNRRGFSLHIHCQTCGWIPYCLHCDVSLVYHKKDNKMRCHYCGYGVPVPDRCPECGNTAIIMKGYGTEKVEEDIKQIFPDVPTLRMDLDSTRQKMAHQKIIQSFESGKTKILIGTQMVTKGFDFGKVMLVAILNADNLLSYPDFRAFERGYQMMAQIAGRAGRRDVEGKVIIQTYNPSHNIINMVKNNDYHGFYDAIISERQEYFYPPFVKIISISVRHSNQMVTDNAAKELAIMLKKVFANRVLGPEYPNVSKIRNFYIKNIIIKLEKTIPLSKSKQAIFDAVGKMQKLSGFTGVRVIIDVDPM